MIIKKYQDDFLTVYIESNRVLMSDKTSFNVIWTYSRSTDSPGEGETIGGKEVKDHLSEALNAYNVIVKTLNQYEII